MKNEKRNRIFSIADIHGEFNKLENLMYTLYFKHGLDLLYDKLVFTGDYVDRGPKSFEVLQYLFKLQKANPKNVICLAGNHEYLMLDYYKGDDPWRIWWANGGTETMSSFWENGYQEYPAYLLKWIEELPLFYKTRGFFFSHAPIPKEEYRKMGNQGKKNYTFEELVWAFQGKRCSEDEFARVHGSRTVGVCGHIHDLFNKNPNPRFYPHYIFGDSGCGCSKDAPLCAINVRTREVIYSI